MRAQRRDGVIPVGVDAEVVTCGDAINAAVFCNRFAGITCECVAPGRACDVRPGSVLALGAGGGDTVGVSAELPDAAAVERIGELLRSRGLRRMPSRIAVLAVLEPHDGHLSVAEIHQRIVDSTPAGAPRPDLATVYRTVTTLVEQGVLHALTVEGGISTYGLAAVPHHHAVCTECGTIIEVPATRLSTALEHAIEGSSFTLSEQAGLTLHGLCPDCQHDG
jgi:Fur family transcriptional regulator, ferric uptake regulator